MIPHRWWRARVTVNNGDQYARVGEMVLRAVTGGPNLAVGGAPYASTAFSGSGDNSAAAAFDGNPASAWAGAMGPASIGYTFAVAQSISELAITCRADAFGPGGAPRDFTIESSDDGVTWGFEWAVFGQTAWAQGEVRTFARPVDQPDAGVVARTVAGLLFGDDFNRADGPLGANYATNGDITAAAISGGRARIDVSGPGGVGGRGALSLPNLAARIDWHVQVTASRSNLGNYFTPQLRIRGGLAAPTEMYQFDIGAASDGLDPHKSRLYRMTGGGYTRLAGGFAPAGLAVGVMMRHTFSTIGTEQRGWIDGVQAALANDATAANQLAGVIDFDCGEVGGAGFILIDDLVVCTGRVVTVTGLPNGWMIRAGNMVSAAAAGGSATLDLLATQLPCVLEVLSPTGQVRGSFSATYGGDTLRYTGKAMPAVPGVVRLDVDADVQPSRTDGAAITPFDNSTYNRAGGIVTASPTWRANTFPVNGRPSIRTAKAASGFTFSRPVEDDWTIYAVVKNPDANSSGGGQWYQASAFIDSEQGGVGNDFGLNIRADGKLVAGTGGDVSATGTHPLNDGLVHIVSWKRTKATGRVQVWVDGVLDIDFVNNAATLSFCALTYFGFSQSVGQAGVDYGRVIAYDTAHSDADRTLVENALKTAFLFGVPGTPVIVAAPAGLKLHLTSSAFAGTVGDTHATSRWQVTLATDPNFLAVVWDSGEDAVNRLAIDSIDLTPGTNYIARVRHTAGSGQVSAWSLASASTQPGTWLQTDIGPDISQPLTILREFSAGIGPEAGKADSTQYLNQVQIVGARTLSWDSYVVNRWTVGRAPFFHETFQFFPGTSGSSTLPGNVVFDQPIRGYSITMQAADFADNHVVAYDAAGNVLDDRFIPFLGSQVTSSITFDAGSNLIKRIKITPSLSDWVCWDSLIIRYDEQQAAVGGWEQTNLAPDAAWAGTDAAPATVWN